MVNRMSRKRTSENVTYVFPFSLRINALKGRSDGSVNLVEFLDVSLASIFVKLAGRLNRLSDTLFERSLLLLEADQGSLEIVY